MADAGRDGCRRTLVDAFDRGTGRLTHTLQGQWRDDRIEGQGSSIRADGRRYVGNFADGFCEGQGELTTVGGPEGPTDYRGEFRHGAIDGRGAMTWARGARYEGDFVQDRPDGVGTMTISGPPLAKGPMTLDGLWEHGCFLGGPSTICVGRRLNDPASRS